MTLKKQHSKITGVQIAYYYVCHRKLWLFSHRIEMEKENLKVQIGKQLHEERYGREKKDINIFDTINIDFIRKNKTLVLHDVKKSRAMEQAHKYQMYYYLDFLKRHGVDAKGEINYPLVNKKISLELTNELQDELNDIYNKIIEIISNPLPSIQKKGYCKKCAYYEFCFSGEI